MTTEAQPSAMRRKAGAGRPPPEIGRLTAAKAVRAAVVQAADDIAGLAATAGPVEETRTALEPFVGTVPEAALLALIEGPGGRYGLMVLDVQVVAALIEVQTTGRVVPRPAEPRPPTRTDAIMCADFVDRLLELIDQRARDAELDVAAAISGFRYGLALAETRAIAMALDDTAYRLYRFEVDLGRGAKSGTMQLLLPFDPPGLVRTGHAEAQAFADAMRAQVLETQAVLSATLLRRKMSLAEVSGLDVGARLQLPRAALAAITVEALDGTVVARGRLGQVNGHRAVRLTLPLAGAATPGAAVSAAAPATPQVAAPERPEKGLPSSATGAIAAPGPDTQGTDGLGPVDPGEAPHGLGALAEHADLDHV